MKEAFTIQSPSRAKSVHYLWMIVICLFSCLLFRDAGAEPRTVRVGIHQNPPLIFIDEQGDPQGIYADLLRHIAARENWHLEYMAGTWHECLARLYAAEIDLLPAISFTKPRLEIYDFNQLSVLSNWAQVYAQPHIEINSLLDLEGKTVGILKGSHYAEVVRNMIRQFGLNSAFVEKDSYKAIIKAIQNKEVEAGVVSRIFNISGKWMTNVQKTAIVFEPTELRFGLPKGRNADLADAIDRHLTALKEDQASPYYATLSRWLIEDHVEVIPRWVYWLLPGLFILPALVYFAQRKRAQKQLERTRFEHAQKTAQLAIQNHRQLQGLFDNLPDGLCLIDGSRRIQMLSPRMREYLGLLGDGKDVGDILSRIGDCTVQEMLNAPEKGTILEIRNTNRIFEITVNVINIGDSEQNLVIICRDTTEAHQVRTRSEQQNRLAAVGQFAAGIAHDFNNVLTVIMGIAQLLDFRSDLPDSMRQDMQNIYTQGQRASHLIRQVLDFSRKTVAEKMPLDMVPFLKETVKLLERTLPEIQILLEIHAEEAIVNANLVQLQQVLTNMAVNARDAMPNGGTLSVGLDRILVEAQKSPLPDMKPGPYVRWTVRDTGTGMNPEVLAHIFEPFFTTKAPGKGTGLGLSQVIGIVEQHAGKIDVESEVGKGTCFSIYWPEAAQASAEQTSSEMRPQRGNGEMVLLVEDDPGVRMIAHKFLERLNYQSIDADNGREALDILKTRRDIDLVLTDVVMPEMNGLTLVKAMRDAGLDIPIAVMSGYPLEEERGDIKNLRVSAYLNKPLDMNALAQALQRALRQKKR